MEISLHLLSIMDAEPLLEFEAENRAFFEKSVPSRGHAYYTLRGFTESLQKLLVEQEKGFSSFYLIKNEAGKILGRINLVDIDKVNSIAEVGFRIGEDSIGKGVGHQALTLLIKSDLSVKKISGKTTTVNKASMKLLEKNGFKQTGIGEEEFELNGEKMRFVHYLWC